MIYEEDFNSLDILCDAFSNRFTGSVSGSVLVEENF